MPATSGPRAHSKARLIWTASRRHRLLRNLQIRLISIRSLLTTNPSLSLAPPGSTQLHSKAKARTDPYYDEPEYMASRQRKRPRVTYEARRRKPVKEAINTAVTPRKINSCDVTSPSAAKKFHFKPPTTPGLIHLETPIVRKIRQFNTPNRPEHTFDPKTPSGRFTSCQQSVEILKNDISAELFREYNFLLKALKIILEQTQPEVPSKGPLSLMELCLRRTTDVISTIQAQKYQDDEEDSIQWLGGIDAAASMYAHLETEMNPHGQGWQPLRILVLRETTELICRAIEDRLFTIHFTQMVLQAFAEFKLFDEASMVMEIITSQQYDPPNNGNDTAQLPTQLVLLYDFCKRHKRRGLLFTILEHLLYSGQLPGEWLGTQAFMPIWAETLKALSSTSSCRFVMDFAAMSLAVLAHASGCVEQKTSSSVRMCERTFVSVLGAIVALALVSRKINDDQVQVTGSVTRRIVFMLIHCVNFARHKYRRTRNRDPITLLTLAFYLASQGSQDLWSRYWADVARLTGSDLSEAMGPIDTTITRMAKSLLCSIAQGCSRGSSMAPHRHLLCLEPYISNITLVGQSLSSVFSECATILAQRTGDLRDIAYAESLDIPIIKSSSANDGFIWDDALCEWVHVNPHSNREVTRPVVPIRLKRSVNRISTSTNRRSISVSRVEKASDAEYSSEHSDSDPDIIPAKILRLQPASLKQAALAIDPGSDSDDLSTPIVVTTKRRSIRPIKTGKVVKEPAKCRRSTGYINMSSVRKQPIRLTTIGGWAMGSSDDELI